MTKRILSVIIVLAMLVSVLPVQMVGAEQTVATHGHSDAHKCSEHCPGGTITWTPWGVTNGTADTIPVASGHYYLECDLSLTARNDIPAGADVTICLNGWNITETGSGNVSYVSGNLTIADCTATYDADGNYVSGAITGCNASDGGCFNVRRGGKLVLESGKMVNNKANGGGGAVSLQSASGGSFSSFYMYGGEITGNSAASGGGIVANNGGKVFIYGGRIDNNTDKNTGKAIYLVGADSRLTVSGSPYIDQVFCDNSANPGLTVTGLTQGAKIGVKTKTATAALNTVFHVTGTQKDWDCHWVTINGKSVSRDGDAYKFGHFHGAQEYSARTGTNLPTGAVAGQMNYYYLAEDIIRAGDAALAELKNDVTICLNGFEITHNNKANAIYNITDGALVLEDGWAHKDGNGFYRAGGVTYGNTAASTAANGSILSVNGGAFTLKDGIIHGANGASAAVYAVGGAVTVNGGEFRDNTASGSGAAINAREGTVVTMTGGLFKNNKSTANQAGAAYLLRCQVNITGGIFEGNYAKKDAGSLYLHTSTGSVSGVTFQNNKSDASGSGFGVSGAADVTISNVTVTGSQGGNGAVIIQGSAKVTLSDAKITGNDVLRGGGVYLASTADLTLNNVQITGNTASITGGGLYWDGATSKLTLTGNTKITDNTCKNAVSNLYLNHADQMLTVRDLGDGAAIGISNRTGFISEQVSGDYSGKFTCDDGENVVQLQDHRLYIGSAHSHCIDGKTDCGHAQEGWTKWTATDSLPSSAGSYYLAEDVKLTGRWNVSSNIQLCLNGHSITQTQAGQRIMNVTSGTVVLTDCSGTPGVITGGTATADGGAIRVEGANATLKAYNITVSGNTTTGHGGAIFVYNSGKLELNNVKLTGNEAGSTGGAICAREGGQMTLTGCTVENNKSKADGGAIYAHKNTVTNIQDTVVTGNESKASSGGIGFGNTATGGLTNVTISGNKAPNGGGLLVQGSAQVTATNVTIRDNTATDNGGGVYVNTGASLTLKDSEITGNQTTRNGGIYVASNATISLVSTEVTGNQAVSGGGVYVSKDAAVALEGKTVIRGNQGGNLYLPSGMTVQVKTLVKGASVYVTAGRGAFTGKCENFSDYFLSDSPYQMVSYVQGCLHMVTAGEFYHKHCLCDGTVSQCDHENVEWDVWDKTDSLPASGYYYLLKDVTLKGEASISNDLHLCLNGHTVTAAQNKRILSTPKDTEVTISISDCQGSGKLTGGVDVANNTGGGAIFIRAGGTLQLYGGAITGNKSITAAGAILLASNASFHMYGGQISHNGAKDADTYINGGAIYGIANSQVSIHGGKILSNTGRNGGALYVDGTLTITGGEISGNYAHEQGGAIYAKKGDLTISGGQISHNHSLKDGGGVYYREGKAAISGGLFTGNKSDASGGGVGFSGKAQATVSGGTFTDNTSPNGGGMIAQGGSALQLQGGQIIGNTATGAAGGVYISTDSSLNMTGGTVADNKASSNGGGIAVYNGTAALSGGKVSGNSSVKDGGGAYFRASTVEISGDILFTGNSTKGAGGGICFSSKSAGKLSGGIVEKNNAANAGGIVIQGGSNLEITDVTLKNNTASNAGGGIYVNNATLKVSGGKFTGNQAQKSQGGGLYAGGSEVTISGGSFSSNVSQKDGGGIYVNKSQLKLSGGTITGNQSVKGSAGGMGATKEAVITMTGGTVSYNKATNAAGIVIQSKAHLNMYGGTIGYNEGNQGAGIYVNNASANLQGGVIRNNKTKGNAAGAYTYNSKIVLGKNLLVTENHSDRYAGGMYFNMGTLEMTGTKFTNNTAKMGGGGFYTFKTECIIRDPVVTGNQSPDSTGGGVVLSRETKFDWQGGIIQDNHAKYGGGGLLIQNWAEGTVKGLTIANNESAEGAGGLYTYTCVDATFVDCEFTGNKTGTSGGAVSLSSTRGSFDPLSYINFIGCDIHDNEAGDRAGGVYCSYQVVSTWTDCKIRDNVAANMAGGMYTLNGSVTTMDNVKFTGNEAGATGAALWIGDDMTMHNVVITGNKTAEGAAVVFPVNNFDGESYQMGHYTMSGDIIIADNQGTQQDLYIPAGTAIGSTGEGFGKNTKICVELEAGILTNTILAAYDYEGGDRIYTLTYGDRSTKEPEYEAPLPGQDDAEQQNREAAKTGDILLYVGIGVFAGAVSAAVAAVISKKKKAAKAQQK